MDFVIDFLVGNYMWFLVITIILIFSLIGYIVDSKEHKEVSIFDSPQELAKNLEMLAVSAQNKTIGDAVKTQNHDFSVQMGPTNNTIVDQSNMISTNNSFTGNTNQMTYNNQNITNTQVGQNNMQNQMGQNLTNPNGSFEILGK